MYKIKQFFKRISNLYRWFPIIWNDRDWDYYFIYEILKQKLKHVEQHTIKYSHHINAGTEAKSIRTAIELIDKVQNEYYLDKYLSGATKWNKKEIDKAVEDHDTLKQELFQHLNNNIEKWWD
jgi:hypothetical protein